MKIEIDWRPKKEGQTSDFFGIRLYPETNEEMADLERFIAVGLKPNDIMRIVSGDSLNYLIKFENEKDKP
jgi:hypothetical protein